MCGSLGQPAGNSGGRPCRRQRRAHRHQPPTLLRALAVSTSQHQPRHIFLDKVTSPEGPESSFHVTPRVGRRLFTNPLFQPHDDSAVESTAATLEHQHQKRFSCLKVYKEAPVYHSCSKDENVVAKPPPAGFARGSTTPVRKSNYRTPATPNSACGLDGLVRLESERKPVKNKAASLLSVRKNSKDSRKNAFCEDSNCTGLDNPTPALLEGLQRKQALLVQQQER
ncbi:hypothetical protein MTO96_005736 [Rhipicephalus appendiculatus]